MKSSPHSCDLCGLPLPKQAFTLPSSAHTYTFCCKGCKRVFQMLAEKNGGADPAAFRESELFKKCQEMGLIPKSEEDLAWREATPASAEDAAAETREDRAIPLNLKVGGMWCPACAWVIEESLKKRQGISNVHCSFSSDRMRCDYDPMLLSPSQIMSSIAALGYDPSPAEGSEATRERKREVVRFAVSAFLTVNVMMFSFSLYAGFFTEFSLETIHSLSWPIFVMASIVLLYGGRRIYQRAWTGVTSAAFGMETLITLGAVSAYLYSTYQFFSGSIHLYYDTACMLIVLVTLGKFLESKAKAEVKQGLEFLFALKPTKVKILLPGQNTARYVSASQLNRGDLFQVEEGETVPADGMVFEGTAAVDESSLTGEARPVTKAQADTLRSGVKLIQGRLKVRAEKAVEDSTLSQLLSVLDKTLTAGEALPGKTDRLLRWFVPLVIGLAAGTGVVCLILGLSPETAVLRSLTVLVISCPCTLGVAVPLARVAGISIAGKKGILVREFSAFEQAEKLDTLVFDKTGTITRGQWKLLKILPAGALTAQEALAIAASLEQESEHFIAKEIVKRARQEGLQLTSPTGVTISENGITGDVNSHEVRIGSSNLLKEEIARFIQTTPTSPPASRGREVPDTALDSPPLVGGVGGGGSQQTLASLSNGLEQLETSGHSLVFTGVDKELSAVFVFGDEIKQEAPKVIRELKTMGYHLHLISGDGPEATKAVAKEAGIEPSHGALLPENKAAFIREVQNEGHRVAMVGDGINDAPALAQAELGIGISSGNDLGKEAGGITLMRGDLTRILDFLRLAKRVNQKIRQNLLFSALYNVIAIPVAMTGLLNPLIAVTAMLLSSLSVIGNTLFLIRRPD